MNVVIPVCVCVCFLMVGLVVPLAPSGLGSIIEYWAEDRRCSEALYLCEVCAVRLGKADVRNHIMGSLHRYNYIVRVAAGKVCNFFCCRTSGIEGLFFFLLSESSSSPPSVRVAG